MFTKVIFARSSSAVEQPGYRMSGLVAGSNPGSASTVPFVIWHQGLQKRSERSFGGIVRWFYLNRKNRGNQRNSLVSSSSFWKAILISPGARVAQRASRGLTSHKAFGPRFKSGGSGTISTLYGGGLPSPVQKAGGIIMVPRRIWRPGVLEQHERGHTATTAKRTGLGALWQAGDFLNHFPRSPQSQERITSKKLEKSRSPCLSGSSQ